MRKLNKLLAVLVCMAMAVALLPAMTVTAAAPVIKPVKPTVGSGTKKDPYEIGTAAELYWFADQVNTGHGNISVVLTDDIEINKNPEYEIQ